MGRPSHIFIVGSFRSGTTLLRHTLSRSPDVAICGETHFLGHLLTSGYRHKFAQIGDLSSDQGIRKIVDYIYEQQSGDYWKWVRENVKRDYFLQKLLTSDRTDKALFDLVMTLTADGKPIRGEKTPAHIYHVPTLMEWFPNAKIIHTIRDPRAIFVSENRKKSAQETATQRYKLLRRVPLALEAYLSFHVLISWLWIAHLHQRYRTDYPDHYFLSRYEDLVNDPKRHLENICDFLDIDFSDTMLEQGVVNSSFAPRQDGKPSFDTTAIERWRLHLHPILNKWFVLWCRRYLLDLGYQL